jgi:hypothetical protein
LADESTRAQSHHDDYLNENTLIIHPEFENPEDHLTFEGEVIKPRNGSVNGRVTILRTGLNRKKLQDDRFELLKTLKTLAKIAIGNFPESLEAKEHFKAMGQPESQYSLMVKINFPHLV